MSELRVKLALLRKPDAKCEDTYRLEEYVVCISGDMYLVYDSVAEDPNIDLLISSVEHKIVNLLTEKDFTPEEVINAVDERFRYVLKRQYYGYGMLEPFFKDKDVVDIHIVLGEPVQIIHRKYGRLTTNVKFETSELQELALRISSLAGKTISEASPLLSFIEPEHEARITLVYFSDVTLRKGMTIDIRKQPDRPWTVLKLIDMKTATLDEIAFLWLVMKYKVPIFVIGELMSGKTTFSNAILNLIPPNSRVMTIEDAPELRLHTPFWTRTTTRESKYNPIQIFDLLKIAMRITADYIVVGEVRGEEAREWAQAILLGHGGLTTFHAESPEAALIRLTNPPIKVNPEALKLLSVFVKMIPLRTSARELVRRSEVFIHEDNQLFPLFRYEPNTDEIVGPTIDPLSFKFFSRVMLAHGVSIEWLKKEYEAMRKVLMETYYEAKRNDPSLSEPDYKKLPQILFKKLDEVLRG